MGNDEETFQKAWDKHISPAIEDYGVVLTLRPDQVEELRDLLNDMLDKGEQDGTNK